MLCVSGAIALAIYLRRYRPVDVDEGDVS